MQKQISVRMQPIYNVVENEIYGYEVLSDSICVDYSMFATESEKRYMFAKPYQILKTILENNLIDRTKYLFINLTVDEVKDIELGKHLFALCQEYNFKSNNLHLEICEDLTLRDIMTSDEAWWFFRKNFCMVLDDFGVHNYFEPKFIFTSGIRVVKFDRSLLREHESPVQTIVRLRECVDDLQSSGIVTVLEGIENEVDLACCVGANVSYGQGYFLGRPKEVWRGYVST